MTDVVGERWQCGGAFAMTLDADGMDPMPFSLIFGPTNQGGSTDSHQEPFVMACCGPLGAPDPFCDGLHIWACYMDMIQQMCTGIPTRLKEGIESAEIPDTKGINDLQKHLASHTQECFDFFTTQSGLGNIPPTSCPAPSSWENEIGGLEMVINETFGLTIINPSIRIDTAIVAT